MYTIAIVAPNRLLREGVMMLVEQLGHYRVAAAYENSKQLVAALKTSLLPDIVILDIKVPLVDGRTTAIWLKQNFPQLKVVVLYLDVSDTEIEQMLTGVCAGWLRKTATPAEFECLLNTLMDVSPPGSSVRFPVACF